MALGKTNRIDGKAYSLKLKLKDGESFLEIPQFDVQEKQGDKFVSIARETDVAGDLVKIETRVFDHDKGPIRSFKLALKDFEKNEIYFVDVGLGSGLGRGLANSILNLKGFTNVQVGLYGQKSKKDGKTYGAVSVRQGDEEGTVKWKYDPKAEKSPVPAIREYPGKIDPKTKKPKMEKDDSAQQEFFLAQLNEFAAVVEEAAKKGPKSAPKQAATAQEPAKAEASEDGEAPF